MTDDSHRFTPIARARANEALPLHEGKTFHQYTDRWKAAPRYAIRRDAMRDKPRLAASVRPLSPRIPGDFAVHRRPDDDRGDHSARSHLWP